jgi:hypothetical protein
MWVVSLGLPAAERADATMAENQTAAYSLT